MANRFDICITRLETRAAREALPSHPIGDQNRARRDKDDAKPVRGGEALAQKRGAKDSHKHHA